jgi:hypothetical protein
MLGHAALTPAAVLAPEWCPNHARHAEMRLVVLPLTDQVVDNSLLFGDPVELGNETRVVHHGPRVEEASHGNGNKEHKVPQPCAVCRNLLVIQTKSTRKWENLPSPKAVPGKITNSQFNPAIKRDAAKIPAIQG